MIATLVKNVSDASDKLMDVNKKLHEIEIIAEPEKNLKNMDKLELNQQNNTYLDIATFTVGIFIYKFTYSLEYLNPEFLYQILISSLVNYFLFRILNITIGKNVLKQKI